MGSSTLNNFRILNPYLNQAFFTSFSGLNSYPPLVVFPIFQFWRGLHPSRKCRKFTTLIERTFFDWNNFVSISNMSHIQDCCIHPYEKCVHIKLQLKRFQNGYFRKFKKLFSMNVETLLSQCNIGCRF